MMLAGQAQDPRALPRRRKGRNTMPTYRFQVVIEQDEEGLYVAECPALEGCYTQGGTFEEAVANIEEVIRMCVRELDSCRE